MAVSDCIAYNAYFQESLQHQEKGRKERAKKNKAQEKTFEVNVSVHG